MICSELCLLGLSNIHNCNMRQVQSGICDKCCNGGWDALPQGAGVMCIKSSGHTFPLNDRLNAPWINVCVSVGAHDLVELSSPSYTLQDSETQRI